MLSGTYKPAITATVTHKPGAVLRDQPTLAGNRIARLAQGQSYRVLTRTADSSWLLVQVESQRGWVWRYHLRLYSETETLAIVSES